ncbi:tetratricopeptide repeat protein [Candidatus Pelagibacter sp. HIMB1485]|uniref:tetratricopeptide repeat protein n=1 Tax=Candidatus Pelagibacter sp. HIMB1485 TaxID=3415415 RepID=UPI003F8246AC
MINNLKINQLFTEAFEFYNEQKLEQSKSKYEEIIELDPLNLQSHNNLGLIHKQIGNFDEAIKLFNRAIKIDASYQNAYNNLGIVFLEKGNFYNAIDNFKKLISINSHQFAAYCNLGLCYEKINEAEKAIHAYNMVPSEDKNYLNAQYNLGLLYFKIKQYKKAIKIFKNINFKKSQSYLLKSLYELNDKEKLSKKLDIEIKNKNINALNGSIIYLSKNKFGIRKKNLFCENPLDFIQVIDLNEICDFKDLFVKTSKNIIESDEFKINPQPLLINGVQSANNIFFNKNNNIPKIKKVIDTEIQNYYKKFLRSEEGFLKNWPRNYYIDGWLIKMKSGGNIKPHIHEHGWLSGSIYINVPKKMDLNSGNLVVSLDDKKKEDLENSQNSNFKIINLKTGTLCLFPASLFHYTIPFKSDEDRIVLAFDVIAN